jgi:N-methylhydantoinase A
VIFPRQRQRAQRVGTLVSPVRIDLARSMVRSFEAIDHAERDHLLDECAEEGRRVLAAAGVPSDRIRFRYGLDARYLGQGNELTIWVGDGEQWPARRREVVEHFERELPPRLRPHHSRRHGRGGHVAPVGLRQPDTVEPVADVGDVTVSRAPSAGAIRPHGARPRHAGVPTRRPRRGQRLVGPAIVEERGDDRGDQTGLVVDVADDGSLVAERSNDGFDPIELEVLWQSLIATVNEQARALQRAAFSPIVREAGDLANAVFDQRGAWSPRPSRERPGTSTPWHAPRPRAGAVPAALAGPATC